MKEAINLSGNRGIKSPNVMSIVQSAVRSDTSQQGCGLLYGHSPYAVLVFLNSSHQLPAIWPVQPGGLSEHSTHRSTAVSARQSPLRCSTACPPRSRFFESRKGLIFSQVACHRPVVLLLDQLRECIGECIRYRHFSLCAEQESRPQDFPAGLTMHP